MNRLSCTDIDESFMKDITEYSHRLGISCMALIKESIDGVQMVHRNTNDKHTKLLF